MNSLIYFLIHGDAPWWMFWHPGSGFTGGCIMGAILVLIGVYYEIPTAVFS